MVFNFLLTNRLPAKNSLPQITQTLASRQVRVICGKRHLKIPMNPAIVNIYGNRVRVRVCGLCYDGDALLLVNHQSLGKADFWAPPGGGVDFGLSIAETLKKEFQEETNLTIEAGAFAFGCEFINPPLHAIELFFHVSRTGGELQKGYDPELQIIKEVAFLTPQQILALPAEHLHGIFTKHASNGDLQKLKGFYRI
jgi:8-oxo-dGTP diphosphatase